MKTYRLTAVIWKENRSYVAKCPELGVASFGPSPEKAKLALSEAVELYLANARKLGLLGDIEPILISDDKYTTPLDIAA